MSTEFLQPEGTDAQSAGVAFGPLSDELTSRLDAYGDVVTRAPGSVLYLAGRDRPELHLVVSGEVEVIGYSASAVEEVLVRYRPGGIVGELALLTGQSSFVTARVPETAAGGAVVRRIDHTSLRRIMSDETELSDALLRMFIARRELLRTGVVSQTIEVIGDSHSRASLALRTYAARQGIPHVWIESGSPSGRERMLATDSTAADLPMVFSPKGVFVRTTPGELAQVLGLTYPAGARDVDLVVVGAGPAGMAAAVYGASEGLDTVVLDAVSVGGQAAASARIENYLGFSSGISGADLLAESLLQAEKFGAQIYAPCAVSRLSTDAGALTLELADGTTLAPRAVIIATGARYRALPLERWDEFENTSIFYAATELEVRECAGQPVVIVGGANSAGQAALHLARAGNTVTVVVRGALRAKMSSYLADRLVSHPLVTVVEGTQVVALHGDGMLAGVTIAGPVGRHDIAAGALFCFAGAVPETGWLTSIAIDDDGFVLTDADLPVGARTTDEWRRLGRPVLPFETSMPSVFAVGDARRGSMKRVAAAVGEGASAVHSVHKALGWTG